jgi:hypothetical protein
MTTQDLERQLGAYLDERTTSTPPDGLIERSLAQVDATRQRPGWLIREGWRPSGYTANRALSTVAIGVAAVALLLVAWISMGLPSSSIGYVPTASPSPSLSPTPSPAPTPSPTPEACLDGPCLGPLRPGTYSSSGFLPQVRYTVPAGWDNTLDIRGQVNLRFDAGGTYTYPYGGTWSDGISIFRRPVAASPDAKVALAGVGTTASELATWLDGHGDLDSTGLVPVTIGGASGFRINVANPAGPRTNPDRCTTDHGDPRCASLFISDDPAAVYGFGIVGPETAVVYLLDTPSGDTVMAVIDDVDGVAADVLVAAATPIVESLVFSP